MFDFWTEIHQIFALFFGKLKTPKIHSEINWPLVSQPKNVPLERFFPIAFCASFYLYCKLRHLQKNSWKRYVQPGPHFQFSYSAHVQYWKNINKTKTNIDKTGTCWKKKSRAINVAPSGRRKSLQFRGSTRIGAEWGQSYFIRFL